MTESISYPSELKDTVKEFVNSATNKANSLKKEAEKAHSIQNAWESLLLYMNKGWHLHILNLLDSEPGQQLVQLEKVGATIAGIKLRASEGAEALIRHYPRELEQASNDSNLPLDRDSPHPRYKFDNGFFRLEIDSRKRTAKLADNERVLETFPADIGKVVEVVQREHKRVFGRKFDGQKFIRKLRRQYLAILKRENLEDGAGIPIRRITTRLGKNEKGFRTDEFLMDLSRVIDEGATSADGFVLDLQQTKDTDQGMLLHGPAGRGYVGFISFRKESK